MKICLCIAKTFHFIRKKHFSCFEPLLLKLHLAHFLAEGEVFEHPWPSNLIICTKHRIGVLRSYKEVICAIKLWNTFCKKLKLLKICLLHCKKHFISLERNIFHVFKPLLLKLHLATFSRWGEVFEHPWPSNLIICTKHRIGVLRSYKEVILCN